MDEDEGKREDMAADFNFLVDKVLSGEKVAVDEILKGLVPLMATPYAEEAVYWQKYDPKRKHATRTTDLRFL